MSSIPEYVNKKYLALQSKNSMECGKTRGDDGRLLWCAAMEGKDRADGNKDG